MNWEQIGKWAGAVTAVIVLAAAVLWGVPYYIKAQVRTQVTAELAEQAVSGEIDALESIAKANAAALQANGAILIRMEGRMVARDQLFAAYLERQAALAAERAQ